MTNSPSSKFASRLVRPVLAIALLLLAFLAFGAYRGSHVSTGFVLGTTTRGDLVKRVTIAGSISPNQKTVISAPYSGYVKKLYVKIGDHVKAGDPIVSLTQSLTAAHEEVYPMRAPFDGVVVQVLKTEGEYVDPTNTNSNGTGIVRIDDLTHFYVDATSPEVEIGKLKVGQEAIIKSSSILSRTYKGRIRFISLAAKEQRDWDKSRVEFSVMIDVLDDDTQLKSGMSVICDIVAEKASKALMLRQEYVEKDGDKYFVSTEAGVRKEVEIGLQNEEAFEIRKGLVEGEQVRQIDFLSITASH
jgi:multidrug efflux pump subunit AcrA (membrane-fusion protein)